MKFKWFVFKQVSENFLPLNFKMHFLHLNLHKLAYLFKYLSKTTNIKKILRSSVYFNTGVSTFFLVNGTLA